MINPVEAEKNQIPCSELKDQRSVHSVHDIESTLILSDEIEYIGETRDGKPHGQGRKILSSTRETLYDGNFENGLEHRKGSKKLPDGNKYVGEFQNGLAHGKGQILSPTEEVLYEGEFRNGLEHGEGSKKFPNGNRYVGEFQNGLFNGRGRILSPTGEVLCDAEFRNGRIFGQARVLHSKNGFAYEGMMANDYVFGPGKISCLGKVYYEGDFQDGFPHGRGTLYFQDGSSYTGEVERGLPHGKGIIKLHCGQGIYLANFQRGCATVCSRTLNVQAKDIYGTSSIPRWGSYDQGVSSSRFTHIPVSSPQDQSSIAASILPRGMEYLGETKDKKPHGKGYLIHSLTKTVICEAIFQNGLQHGPGKIYSKKGEILYDGGFRQGKLEGYARAVLASGFTHEGIYEDNYACGLGKVVFQGMTIYEGDFKKGEPDGKGKFFFRNGAVYEGEISAGLPQGEGSLTLANGGGTYQANFQRGRASSCGKTFRIEERDIYGTLPKPIWGGVRQF